jgi:hypothetical protein
MRYLLLIYEPPRSGDPNVDMAAAELGRYAAFTQETRDRGVYLGGEALEPVASATSVRVRNGQTLTTDGPFAETKEELGGYYLLDCRDLDEAIELAARIPAVERGTIEIRPIWELPAEYSMESSSAGAVG